MTECVNESRFSANKTGIIEILSFGTVPSAVVLEWSLSYQGAHIARESFTVLSLNNYLKCIH